MKLRVIALSVILALFVGVDFASALDYTVTIDGTSLNKNTDYILQEDTVGGGHQSSHKLIFNNASAESAAVVIDSSQILNYSKLLDASDLKLSTSDGQLFSNEQYYNLQDKQLLCLAPGESDYLSLNLHVDEDIDNSFQGLNYEIKTAFFIHSGCDETPVEPEVPTTPGEGEIDTPNTGIFGISNSNLAGLSLMISLAIIYLLGRKIYAHAKK